MTYHLHKPTGKFLKDCLHTAEEIMHKKQFTAKQADVRSIVKATGEAFGSDSAENKSAVQASLAEKEPVDRDAEPDVGEAYLMYELGKIKVDAYEYHAAAVIARDRGDTVTIEVLGGVTAATKRSETGTFRMYSPGEPFHSVWARYFQKPVTIVISPGEAMEEDGND